MKPLPERPTFLRVGDAIVLAEDVRLVDLSRVEELHILVYMATEEEPFILDGANAVDFLMRVSPSVFEGKRLRFVKHAWAIHNLIGHPFMQLCAWLGKPRLGIWFHDLTIPRPQRAR